MKGTFVGRTAAPLAVLAFWGGMAAAAHAYSAGYDWPYQTISVLLYRDQNPHGYLWAWLGLWLCGLAGLAWTANASRRVEGEIATSPPTGFRLLQSGFLFMCCAVLPDRLLPWSKGHELFAILAFLGISIGVTRQLMLTSGDGATGRTMIGRLMPALPIVPLLLASATQAYLALERPKLPWVTPAWRVRGISPLLSFALWEWVSCTVFSISLLVLWRRRLVVVDGPR